MTILNRPSDGLSSVLLCLWKAVRVLGPMPRERLLSMTAPPSLGEHSKAFSDQKMAKQTLSRWTKIGLFIEKGKVVSLAEPFVSLNADGDPEYREFRGAVRRITLDKSNNTPFIGATPGQCSDFTFALCWALSQDVFSLPGGGYAGANGIEAVETDQISEQPYAFKNDTRWAGFRDWADFLEFGWTAKIAGSQIFAVDPTIAVASVLPEVFGKKAVLEQDVFFARLAETLPVIDLGRYRVAAQKRFGGRLRATKKNEISPSLTRALTRLEIGKQIKLEARADANQRVLLGRGFEVVVPVSHIVWRPEA